MWIRSDTSNTFGMLWLIRMTGRPLALICWIRFSTCPVSLTPSAAVGSSSTTNLVANVAARATATAWR